MAERKRNKKTPTTAAVTTGSPIRMQPPKSARKPKPKPDVNPVGGFADFLREYTVITLAIGFVVATQVQGLVKLLVGGFVDPFTQLMFGEALSNRTFTLHWHNRAANFNWGGFIYGLITFLVVLVVIYVIIKLFSLDKLTKPKK